MPLLEVSPNIQELDSACRKRSHDEYSNDMIKMDAGSELPSTVLDEAAASKSPGLVDPMPTSPAPPTPTKASSEAKDPSNADNPERAPTTTVTLPVKRKRLTGAEKEARDKEAAEQKKIREQMLAEKAAIKAVEKAKQEEAKTARAKERDEKRRKKEEEQQRAQEEKDRKARSQKTLGSFFKIPSTPKKTDGDAVNNHGSSPVKPDAAKHAGSSAYSIMFKPFFLKENVRLAPLVPLDQEMQRAKCRALDGFIASQSSEPPGFTPAELFAFPPRKCALHRPVRHILETAYRESQDASSADAARIHAEARRQLSRIPMKVISFSQDVRPPYYGTLTFKAYGVGADSMRKVARRSTSRRLPLDYDYDSEAEWQDEEEGEDLDVDDDEEELDDEDDMDGFLDDSEDVAISRRAFGTTMEPESTGVCFEDEDGVGPNPALYKNKMEFMLESLEQCNIDPFATKYWEPALPSKSDEAKLPPKPSNAFAAIQAGTGPKVVKPELMNDFKQTILDNKALSKVGIIDILFHQFRDSVSRAEVKNTLEIVAEKKGAGRIKEWELRPGHGII